MLSKKSDELARSGETDDVDVNADAEVGKAMPEIAVVDQDRRSGIGIGALELWNEKFFLEVDVAQNIRLESRF